MKKWSFTILTSLLLTFSCPFTGENAVAESLKTSSHYNVGQWIPSDQLLFDQWLEALVEGTESANRPLFPVIQKFKELIEEDPQLYMLFNQMFEQVPNSAS